MATVSALVTLDFWFPRQLQQQQAELEVHQRDGLSSYDLSQVSFWNCLLPKGLGTAFDP